MSLYCPVCRAKLCPTLEKCTFCGAEIRKTQSGDSLVITVTATEGTLPEYIERIKAEI